MNEGLTNREFEVCIAFSLLPDKYKHYRFSLPAKKKALAYMNEVFKAEMKMSGINTYLGVLRKKGFLIVDSDRMTYIRPAFEKAINKCVESIRSKKEYEFTLKIRP